DEEQQKILWNKVHIRQKELANRKRVLKAQKSRMNNLNPEKQFVIDYPVRVIRHSNTKGKIRIEDNKSAPVFFENKFFMYIWHLAQKAMNDDIDGKTVQDKGWLTDKQLVEIEPGWKKVRTVRTARSRVKEFLQDEGTIWEKLFERARVEKDGKNKGFRISSPLVIAEDKSQK
ncbi:MAG: hypothetical protein PHV82_13810, partial [Victivallaceae bacterium]|nr:hypothetical protein [Victivallaceae bacterium]